jgi:hypothetical protein
MGFYKTTLIIAIIHLIIFLAILGVVMSNKSQTQMLFPNEISKCPDFYQFDGTSCMVNSGIYAFPNNSSCQTFNLSAAKYLPKGTGSASGLCAKKNDATTCNITWDGITNNSNICKD